MNKYYTGALKSPKDLRNYHIAKVSKMVELPSEFVLNHAHIKDQGRVGSCVAHSVSSLLETKDDNDYSTGWIYGYRPADYWQDHGMFVSDALKTIKNVGYLLNKDLNVNVEMQEAKEIVDKNLSEYMEKAKDRKINAYAYLASLNQIKEALYTYKTPVIVCIDIDENGLKLDDDYVAYVPTKPEGGHATLCYGWNEKGLLIQNSWGENWGNKGTFILPYEYPVYEAWFIDMSNKEEPTPSIEKPNLYWLRELIMIIIKFLRKILRKE